MVECTFVGLPSTRAVSSHILRKGSIVLGCIEISSKIVATFKEIVSAEDSQGLSNPKFLNCQEVLSVGLTGLVEGKFLGQFLSSDSDWERIFA